MGANELLQTAYAAFNARDIDGALSLMHPDVLWPNGWEGGHVYGHDQVRAYWERQWAAVDSYATPVRYTVLSDGRIQADVQLLVKDKNGTVLTDVMAKHIYTIENGLVRTMEIE